MVIDRVMTGSLLRLKCCVGPTNVYMFLVLASHVPLISSTVDLTGLNRNFQIFDNQICKWWHESFYTQYVRFRSIISIVTCYNAVKGSFFSWATSPGLSSGWYTHSLSYKVSIKGKVLFRSFSLEFVYYWNWKNFTGNSSS